MGQTCILSGAFGTHASGRPCSERRITHRWAPIRILTRRPFASVGLVDSTVCFPPYILPSPRAPSASARIEPHTHIHTHTVRHIEAFSPTCPCPCVVLIRNTVSIINRLRLTGFVSRLFATHQQPGTVLTLPILIVRLPDFSHTTTHRICSTNPLADPHSAPSIYTPIRRLASRPRRCASSQCQYHYPREQFFLLNAQLTLPLSLCPSPNLGGRVVSGEAGAIAICAPNL